MPNPDLNQAEGAAQSAADHPLIHTLAEPAWPLSIGLGVATGLGITLAADFLLPARDTTTYLLFYLIGVVLLASRFGWRASVSAAVVSVLASDFLLVPPYLSFAVARPQDVITLAVFIWAALVVSHLTTGLRRAYRQAQARERRLRVLYEFLRQLALATEPAQVVQTVLASLNPGSPWKLALLKRNADGQWTDLVADQTPGLNGTDRGPKQKPGPLPWLEADLQLLASEPDARLRILERQWLVPVLGDQGVQAILAWFHPGGVPDLDADQREWLQAAGVLVAQTLGRIEVAREAQHAQIQARAEAARNAMLSAIAHDLRTPLASITAASSTLAAESTRLAPEQQQALLQAIIQESKRLSHLADSTLEMARLGAGPILVRREWYPVEEVVGAVLSRMASTLLGREIHTQLPQELVLMQADEALIVRVLENLLSNAVKYTPEGSPLQLSATQSGRVTQISLRDHGPGLEAGEEQRIFDRFTRGRHAARQSGAGLGLTICRLIVEAHGGRIWARNHDAGGAEFTFTIVAEEDPPSMDLPMDTLLSPTR